MKKNDYYIPFCRPYITDNDIREVVGVLKSNWIGTGPKTQEFEELFREYIGCDYAIALNSCTAALHLALIALGIGPGDEVITTPMTFAATANVIEHVGARPVFVDIEPSTLTIDTIKIEDKVTRMTKAILPVHFAGHPAEMGKIEKISKAYRLSVVEDAAHAIESKYNGRKIGAISDFTAFSFYATKNITTAEGGMLTTRNRKMYEKIRILSLHGMTKDAWKRYSHRGIVSHFEIFKPGFKYNMFDLQAALGINQMRNIKRLYERRKQIYKLYKKELSAVDGLSLPVERGDIVHSYHLFIVLLELAKLKISRDKFRTLLEERNIGTGVHYISLHKQPFYKKKYGLKDSDFPVASTVSDRTLSLPLYNGLKDEEVMYIIECVKDIARRYRR